MLSQFQIASTCDLEPESARTTKKDQNTRIPHQIFKEKIKMEAESSMHIQTARSAPSKL